MERPRLRILAPILTLLVLGLTFPFPCIAEDLPIPPSPYSSISIATPAQVPQADVPGAFFEPPLSEEPEETLADPLEPVNRVFFHFNDKLYFWVLKPVATGYKAVLPQEFRMGARNFFSNLTTPVRLVNCLLQAKLKAGGNETVRFVLNTTLGLGGFLDPAKKELKIEKTEADFGQTLGVWGLGPSFYIHWPILGPSNLRDTFGFAGDILLDPRTYVLSDAISYVARPVETINQTSLTIGEYESLKKASLDPYIAVKDAYHQYRQNRIRRR